MGEEKVGSLAHAPQIVEEMEAERNLESRTLAAVIPLEDLAPVFCLTGQRFPQVAVVHVVHCQNGVPLRTTSPDAPHNQHHCPA